MVLAALASLLLTAAPPVIVEAGAKTSLGRRLCTVSGDERAQIVDGRLVVPEGVGLARLSVGAGDCAAPEPLAVAVVPAVPREGTVAWIFPDEGHFELRGKNLARATVWWRKGPGPWKSAVCDGRALADGNATCSLPISEEEAAAALADTHLEILRLPPGSPAATGEALPEVWLDGELNAAHPLPVEALRVPSPLFVLNGPLVRATSVEAWREQSLLALPAPNVVASANCRSTGCWVGDDRASLVVVPPATGESVTITARLRDRVLLRQGDGMVNTVTFTLPLARCQLRPLITMVLGGTEDHRLPIALGDRCPSDLSGLAVETTPPSAAYIDRVGGDGKLVEVRLGHVPRRSEGLEVRLTRAATRAIVGSARVDVRSSYTPIDVTIIDPHLGEIAVIPTNRDVKLQWATRDTSLGAFIAPVSLPGYYTLRQQDGETLLRGETKTVGGISLRFGYVVPSSGSSEPLVVFDSDMHFPVRPVNAPISLAPDNARTARLFSVFCHGDGPAEQEIVPGDLVSMPYSARRSCRLRVDRNTLSPADGTQRIRVTVKISSPTGTSRTGGFSQVLVLSAGTAVESVWLGSNEQLRPFDHLSVSLSHDDQPGHYVTDGSASTLPARSYQMVFGDARLRLYASAAVPTGLYRVTRANDGGILQFSAGALVRLAFLDREGREFPLDFETGFLGTNLSGQANLSIVAGIGITVPLLNPQESAKAAVGIHAWVEYAPTRSDSPTRPFALVFGPSISLGDFGTNL